MRRTTSASVASPHPCSRTWLPLASGPVRLPASAPVGTPSFALTWCLEDPAPQPSSGVLDPSERISPIILQSAAPIDLFPSGCACAYRPAATHDRKPLCFAVTACARGRIQSPPLTGALRGRRGREAASVPQNVSSHRLARVATQKRHKVLDGPSTLDGELWPERRRGVHPHFGVDRQVLRRGKQRLGNVRAVVT